jgi:hypothetical protein
MPNEILEGFQVGMNASLRMQQLRSERAAQAARERALVQEMSIQMEKRDLMIQYRADMEKALGKAKMAASPTVLVPGADGAGTFEMPNPNPLSQEDATFQNVLPVIAKYEPDKVPEALRMIATAKYQKEQSQEFTPTAGSVQTPDGRSIPFVKTSPRSAQLVGESTVETINDPQTGKSVTGVRAATGGFKPLPQNIEQRQISKWAMERAPELMVMRDDGTAYLPPENFNEAARRSGLGQAFKTQMLEQMAATSGAFETGQKLLPRLTPENVGVRGAVSRFKDAALGQINPNMKTGTSSEMLATSKAFMAGLVRALRSDGNIGIQEREELIAGMPTPDKLLSSVQDSKVKLAAQLELAAIKSRASANTLGKPITPFFLKVEEIEQMIQSGQLTAEEAAKLWQNNAWNLIGTIRSQVQE